MITALAFAGKHFAVYGLARSGLATVEALLASGAKVTAWDSKEEARNKLLPLQGEVARSAGGGVFRPPSVSARAPTAPPRGESLVLADLDTADLAQFDSLVVTPGLPLNRHPIAGRAREAGVEIIGDIELFARARPELPPHKVVGITGTNGKSTTTALVHHILETAGVPSAMGGNIGLPILAQDPLPKGGVYVLELSSYQIDLTQSLDCDVAVLLNITPDHLDRYESFAAYAASKARLFEMQSTEHLAFVDYSVMMAGLVYGGELHPRPNYFGINMLPASAQVGWPTLQGPHNLQNASAATAVCSRITRELNPDEADHEVYGPEEIPWSVIEEGLRTYPGLAHRMERIREKGGVTFVNDSKATNPTATAPALAAFERIRWICGGQAKTDNLDECAPHFAHVHKAYTIGEAGELFARLLSPHMDVAQCVTLERAVDEAAAEAASGDTILLSPACASFDQFRDFEDRGDQFRRLVEGL